MIEVYLYLKLELWFPCPKCGEKIDMAAESDGHQDEAMLDDAFLIQCWNCDWQSEDVPYIYYTAQAEA